jgi:hypothetical protein
MQLIADAQVPNATPEAQVVLSRPQQITPEGSPSSASSVAVYKNNYGKTSVIAVAKPFVYGLGEQQYPLGGC